jgi:hypothetical protein
MLAVQVRMLLGYARYRERVLARTRDDRGAMYGTVAFEVLGIVAAIVIVGILTAKWIAAAQNSPTTGPGVPGGGGAGVTTPVS